jgi:hypothetical protein
MIVTKVPLLLLLLLLLFLLLLLLLLLLLCTVKCSILAPMSYALALNAKVLYVTSTTEFPSRWFGFPGDPDYQSPHIVRMTEGLMYFDNEISFTNKPYINFGE